MTPSPAHIAQIAPFIEKCITSCYNYQQLECCEELIDSWLVFRVRIAPDSDRDELLRAITHLADVAQMQRTKIQVDAG